MSVFAPVDAVGDALILQCTTVAGEIEGDAPSMRVAFAEDGQAVFKTEAAELDEGAPALSEVLVHTAKLTQHVRLSNEHWQQTNTATQLAQSVWRASTRGANNAFIAQELPVGPALAPVAGLINTSDIVGATEQNSYQIADSLDALVDLVAVLGDNLATPSAILVDPLGWGELSKLKIAANYNQTFLGSGVSSGERRLLGLPVLVDPGRPTTRDLSSTSGP